MRFLDCSNKLTISVDLLFKSRKSDVVKWLSPLTLNQVSEVRVLALEYIFVLPPSLQELTKIILQQEEENNDRYITVNNNALPLILNQVSEVRVLALVGIYFFNTIIYIAGVD